jgi:hypothetical protein
MEIVGEAVISEIDQRTIADVAEYKDKIFLSQVELDRYVGGRRNKKMLVLVLTSLRRYEKPLRMRQSLTMAGQYMTERELADLSRD